MNVTVNGTEKNLEQASLKVTELLKLENVEMPDMVSVELNGEFLERSEFESTDVKDGDQVEFLYFMGGGA